MTFLNTSPTGAEIIRNGAPLYYIGSPKGWLNTNGEFTAAYFPLSFSSEAEALEYMTKNDIPVRPDFVAEENRGSEVEDLRPLSGKAGFIAITPVGEQGGNLSHGTLRGVLPILIKASEITTIMPKITNQPNSKYTKIDIHSERRSYSFEVYESAVEILDRIAQAG